MTAPLPLRRSADARALVAEAAASARELTVVTVPAPVARLEMFLRASPRRPALLWEPPGGPAFAASGAAVRFDACGPDRFDEVRRKAERLWPRVVEFAHPAADAPGPRLWGGFAFVPGAAEAPPWRGFSDACFVLPRWTYGRHGGRAWLQAALAEPDERLVPEYDALVAALGAPAAPAAPLAPGPVPIRVAHLDRAAWDAEVRRLVSAIAGGELEKVVAARRAVVELDGELDDVAVIERLAVHEGCTRFAFRQAGATFLGATPERLVARAGLEVATEALAGSMPVGQASRLLASAKDLAEHALVARAIAERLAPACARLEVPAAPVIRELKHVLHLSTPITGRLRRSAHVLELARALHPTPAVAGVPTEAALRWIAAHEPAPRGWYAAPVGWFDAAGDGEFAVALRSGVIEGRRAHVWAGAGIVRGSKPDAEWAETAWKLRALLGALGVPE